MNKRKILLTCILASALLCVLPRASGAKPAGKTAAAPAAALEQVNGKVLFRANGKTVWQPALENQELSDGDSVRTGAGASAIVNFPDSGYLKLLPLTDITISSAVSPEGTPCGVVLMDQGKVWASLDVKDKGGQFILLTENAVFNGNKASAFIETKSEKQDSCLDVFQGSVNVRTRVFGDQVITVKPRQRTRIGSDQTMLPPEQMDSKFNDSETEYSCITAEPQAAEQAPATAESPENATGQQAAATPAETAETSDSQQEETSQGETITFAPSESAPAETGAAGASGGPAAETGGQTRPANEEDEYETVEIEITGSTTITVVKGPTGTTPAAETTAATACKDKPVISDVFVSGQSAAAGDALTVKSSSKCGPVAKPVIIWSATLKCGTISSMAVTNNGTLTRQAGGGTAAGEAAAGKFSFEVNDSTTRNIVLKALGSNGIETVYAFSVTVPEPEEVPLPRITELLVNGAPVKPATALTIETDICDSTSFYIEGKAKSDCGEIVLVTATAHESVPLTVDGMEDWSTTLQIKETQTVPVSVIVADVTGAKSKPFNFSIDFTKTIAPPTITIDMAGGTPVSASMGDPIDVYRNDLLSGKLVISGGAGSDRCPVKKVEVSVNSGSNWLKADGVNSWSYGFAPREGTYEVIARAFDTDGTESDEMFQPVEITYYPKTREEILQEMFDTIMRAYQDRDADTITTNTASNFSTRSDSIEDRGRMDNALNGKFTDLSTVYVRYRVSNVVVSGKTSGRVTFTWDANPASAGYSHTGTFSFMKDRDGWKLLTVDDDRTFLRYTSIADTMELAAGATRLTANNTDTTTITATVRDSAYNAVKDGTAVRFTASTGTIDSTAVTADGKVAATYTASDAIGTATITATSGGVSSTVNIELLREFAPPPPGP